jgi:hypothetical protein
MTTKKQKQQPAPTSYKPFYLVMLILSTISIAFSAWGIFEAFNLIRFFVEVPLYAGLSLLSIAILPLSIVALVLLYQKSKLGLTLMLTSLAANFVAGIAMVFCADQAFRYVELTSSPQEFREFLNVEGIDPVTLFSIGWYAIIILGSLFLIAAAVLWHYAWQNQQKPIEK